MCIRDRNRGSRQTHIRKSEDHLTEKPVGWASFLSEIYVPIYWNQGKEVCITMAKKAIKCSKMFDSTTSTVRENVDVYKRQVIEGGGVRIDADLPADTAVIPAAVRQTGERSIIGRGKMFHSAESPLLVKYPLLFYHGNEAAGRGFSREISVRGILAPEGIYRVY